MNKEQRMRTYIRVVPLVPAVLAGLVAGCSGPAATPSPAASPSAPAVMEQASPAASPAMGQFGGVVAHLAPTQGNNARGTVTFEPAADGVRITAHLEGLTPGNHGFHLHEVGDCSAPDASSAGAHWNPTGHPHGGPDSPRRHAGDLGNVTADESGTAHLEREVKGLSLDGPHSLRGRSVLVHAKADDLTSQPSGDSGARLACGVIGPATASPAMMVSPSPAVTASPRDPSD
jgi:Cu-Zn family superoxide dismutase